MLAAAQKAVSFEPGNSADQLILAKVLGRLKRYDEARAAASVALADATNPSERAGANHFLIFLDKTDNVSINVTLTAPPQRSK